MMSDIEVIHQEKIKENSTFQKSYENLLETPLPILLIRRDKFSRYVLHSFNQLAQEIFAVPLERLINKEVRIFWPKESWDEFRKGVIASIRKGLISDVSSISIDKEGKTKTFNLKLWRVDNSIACCLFIDTIDKKLFTQSVLDERLKYEELFKNTPVMMANIDLNGTIIDANLYWIDKTGFDRDELIGKNIQDYFVSESNPIFSKKTITELLISDELKNTFVSIRKKSGEVLSSLITARALFDINGKFIRCYLVAHDVSELYSIKQEFQNTEKLLSSLIENSASAILLYSVEKGVVECNLKAEEFLGIRKENILGKKLSDIELLKKADLNSNKLKDLLASTNSTNKIEIEINSNGQKRFFEISFTQIHIKDEPYILIFFLDKSIEKIKDEKILESENRFQILFEASINALKLLDTSGRIIRLNKKAREIYDDFIDKNGQIKIKTKDFDYQKWIKNFIESEKDQDQFEYRIKTKAGLKIIDERLLKITFNSQEKIIFSIGIDVTKEKLAEEELRKSEQNLRNLNDTKNRLIHILSHDLRAPTSSIIGVVNAILDEPILDRKDIQHYLNLIKSAASYQLDLINNLLDWSLLEAGNFNYILEPKNLEYAVYNSLNSIRGLVEQKKVKLDIKIPSELVLIDLNLFSRILINLVSNAIKFSYPESKITIYSEYLKNDRIEIIIKDSGVGFDKEVLEKLFSFKEKVSRHGTSGERGTGLGLSLCKDMVKILGGRLIIESPIKISSKKHRGARVSFDVKLIQPKILVSSKLNKTSIKNSIKKELENYIFVFKDLHKHFRDCSDDYFLFVILDEHDLNNSIVEKITKTYRTKRNIIVVSDKQSISQKDLKKTELEKLPLFLKNEIERIEFEWKQQVSIAKQMKKMWT